MNKKNVFAVLFILISGFLWAQNLTKLYQDPYGRQMLVTFYKDGIIATQGNMTLPFALTRRINGGFVFTNANAGSICISDNLSFLIFYDLAGIQYQFYEINSYSSEYSSQKELKSGISS